MSQFFILSSEKQIFDGLTVALQRAVSACKCFPYRLQENAEAMFDLELSIFLSSHLLDGGLGGGNL